jgi:hypothetical protein
MKRAAAEQKTAAARFFVFRSDPARHKLTAAKRMI